LQAGEEIFLQADTKAPQDGFHFLTRRLVPRPLLGLAVAAEKELRQDLREKDVLVR
jgi:hypothetical protein